MRKEKSRRGIDGKRQEERINQKDRESEREERSEKSFQKEIMKTMRLEEVLKKNKEGWRASS